MPKYLTAIDPRAAATRAEMRKRAPRDLCGGTMRLALHLSESERDYLEMANPYTLGCPDSVQADVEWRRFIEHPDSKPYRVQAA